MDKQELENLAKVGQLKAEPPTRAEFDGMINGAKKRLADAQNKDLAAESRFDLAYGVAHGSPSQLCAKRVTDQKTASLSFKRSPT
jgi:hypothetical protein